MTKKVTKFKAVSPPGVPIPPASKAKVRAAEGKAAAAAAAATEEVLTVFEVRVVRVVEQHAVVSLPAHSAEDAEAVVTQQLENRNPVLLRSLQWSDGEVEAGESVLDVRAVGSPKK